MILVITHEQDRHGLYMLDLLCKRGEDAVMLNYATFPCQLQMSFYPDGERTDVLLKLPDGREISGKDVKSVLNRRQAEPKPSADVKDRRIVDYIIGESRHFLDALPQMLRSFWLNHPDAVRTANRKPYQLLVAKQIGFSIPQTLITNSLNEAEEFVRTINGDVAVKSLWAPGITVERGGKEIGIALYTQRFKKSELLSKLGQVRNCPLILQAYVEKKLELRITVVNRQVFACAIYSQQSEKTREDWRHYDLANTPHEQHQLPAEIEEWCVRLTRKLGLLFGCIDMIVTPSGEYVFLEINPNGQWLWIEHLTKMPISQAVADLLINPP